MFRILCAAGIWLALAACAPLERAPASEFLDPSDGRAPFSQAVRSSDQVYLAGVIGNKGNSLVSGGIEAETHQAIDNLEEALELAGLQLADVAKCTVYMADISEFATMNRVYASRFAAPRPARTTVGGLDLVYSARIEIDCIAGAR